MVARQQERSAERGFSLIELTVVFVILGLMVTLLAYAGTTIARDTRDTEAVSVLDRGATAQRDVYARVGRFSPHGPDIQPLLGRDLTAVGGGGPSQQPNQISMAVGVRGTLALAVKSASGGCFAKQYDVPEKGGASRFVQVADTAACAGSAALPAGEAPIPVASVLTP